MSCIQTLSGLAKDCAANMGGIVEVMIANFADVTGVTITDGVVGDVEVYDYDNVRFLKNLE